MVELYNLNEELENEVSLSPKLSHYESEIE